jgi:hypothetical protein
MVANKPGTPGRARSSRKAIAQGVPDVSACLYRLVGTFPFQPTGPAGAASARHSLRPLFEEGHRMTKLGREIAPRECEGVADRSCGAAVATF